MIHGDEKVSVIVPERVLFGKRRGLTNPNKIKGFSNNLTRIGGMALDR
jgi:hypothetical protein